MGAGEGTTVNVPLPGLAGDTAMATVFEEFIAPVAIRFKPEIILVSAGASPGCPPPHALSLSYIIYCIYNLYFTVYIYNVIYCITVL